MSLNFTKRFCSAWNEWRSEYALVCDIWKKKFPEFAEEEESAPKIELSMLERVFMIIFVIIRSLSIQHLKGFLLTYKARSQCSEIYVILWFIVLITLLNLRGISEFVAWAVVSYRLIDGLNYRLCIIFVDRYKLDWGLRSLNRSLILIFINYFEIVIGFATLYIVTGSAGYTKDLPITTPLEGFYFSLVTITTLGYGDITPIDPTGRALSVIETSMGIILIVLVIGTFLTGSSRIRHKEPSK